MTSPASVAMTTASPVATRSSAPASALVGREHELAAIAGLVVQANVRLLTLVGPGGIGKTRLALASASTLATVFRDGAVFVDLSALTDTRLVVSSIGHAIGVT